MSSAMHTIEATGLGRFMREALWAIRPRKRCTSLESGFCSDRPPSSTCACSALGRRLPVSALAGFAVPWSLAGFVLAATAGL